MTHAATPSTHTHVRQKLSGTPTRIASAVWAVGLLGAFALPAADAADAIGDAAVPVQPRGGVVYVESNVATAGGNSILAYKREPGGGLRAVPGSPFATKGTGVVDPTLALGPFDSDQLVITNPEHTLLFAVNPGSNTVAVFKIGVDGGLVHVSGSPFPSGGSNPVSLGLSKDTLVVVNKAMDPAQPNARTPNYASFHVNAEGQLSPTPLTVTSVATGSSPSQALVSPSARNVFGADFLGGLLQSFVIQTDGSLSQNPPQLLPDAPFSGSSAPRLPLGLASHPSRAVVYVGLVTVNKIAVYQYDANGVLSFVRAVADSGTGVCWVRVNKEGTRLYASNTVDNSITVYDTTDALNPVELQHLVLKGAGEGYQLELDPTGRTLYSISQRNSTSTPLGQGNTLHVMNVLRDGRVAETENSPLALPVPADIRPQGLATF